MNTQTSSRQTFVLPSEVFWRLTSESAQPFLRLGIPMASIVEIAGQAMNQTYIHAVGSGALEQRGGTYRGVHYLETLRQFLSTELVSLYPEMLSDRKEFDRLTFSLVDSIANIRTLLCEYASAHLGPETPALKLERFLGPTQDLVFSYETPQPNIRPYENPDPVRTASAPGTTPDPSKGPYGF